MLIDGLPDGSASGKGMGGEGTRRQDIIEAHPKGWAWKRLCIADTTLQHSRVTFAGEHEQSTKGQTRTTKGYSSLSPQKQAL
jgi:hypothetical protein